MDDGQARYEQFLRGDGEAFAALIEQYKDPLTLFLRGFTEDIGQADELMEDTFVKLYVKRPRFSGRCSFKTWLYTVARNVAIDELRRRKRMLPADGDALDSFAEQEENALEQTVLRDERQRAVRRAMVALTPEYRQALYLAYFENLDNGQIAHVMKKTRRQVENLLYRAKQSLKRELIREGIDDENC